MSQENAEGSVVMVGIVHRLHSRADVLSDIMSYKFGFSKVFIYAHRKLPPLLQFFVVNVCVLIKLLLMVTKRKSKVSVCIVFSYMLTPIVFVLKKLGFIRCLVYDDADYAPIFSKNSISQALVSFLEILGIKTAEVVISASKALKELRTPLTANKIVHVVPNGIDKFCDVHRHSAYQGRPIDVIYLGNIDNDYIYLTNTLEAVANLCREENIKAIIVGSGKDSVEVYRYTEKCEGIKFLGALRRELLPLLLSSSKVGIAPYKVTGSARYGVPLKIKEYLVTTLCVAVTDIKPIRYFLAKTNSCYEIIERPSPEGITYVINRLLRKIQKDYDTLQKIHLAVRDYLCASYSWETLAARYVRMILKL